MSSGVVIPLDFEALVYVNIIVAPEVVKGGYHVSRCLTFLQCWQFRDFPLLVSNFT